MLLMRALLIAVALLSSNLDWMGVFAVAAIYMSAESDRFTRGGK
jgi:hypothetical protein